MQEAGGFWGFVGPLMPLLYLVGLGIALSLIYSIVEVFSTDRVLKHVKGSRAFVFLGGEAHYGRLHIPARSKGGFEVFYTDEGIENPGTLLAFLLENYRETGNRAFLEKARVLHEYFVEKGLLPEGSRLEDIRVNSWAPPSRVSRKVYPGELGSLHMIISFVEYMDEEERRRRWKAMTRLYTRGFLRRLGRRLYNALSYVKDKLASAVAGSTTALLGTLPPDLRKAVQEAQAKTLGTVVGQSYDPLLENSIGRLVTVKVKDVEGEEKLYQGILAEYSDKYIYVMDVDYRLQLAARAKGGVLGNPAPYSRVFGHALRLGRHLEAEKADGRTVLRNVSTRPLKLEKVVYGETEVNVGRVLFPGEEAALEGLPEDYTVHYEIALESDVVWPRSKATVVGLGDYPPRILASVLRGTPVTKLVKRGG